MQILKNNLSFDFRGAIIHVLYSLAIARLLKLSGAELQVKKSSETKRNVSLVQMSTVLIFLLHKTQFYGWHGGRGLTSNLYTFKGKRLLML